MLRFSANLSFLYQEFPFEKRFAQAAADGFKAVEYISPFELPKNAIAKLLADSGLEQALFNMPAGEWDKGERGIASHPDRVDEFHDGVKLAADYAQALGCKQVNCLAGLLPMGVSRETALATFADNLNHAAAYLKPAGIRVLVEPINRFDMPSFLINRTAEAMIAMEAAGSDNLFLQADIYHMQRMEGDLTATLTRLMPRIAHIQIADNPGRHEPGTGEINFAFLFKLIKKLGYNGWIGCEYRPLAGTREGLAWIAANS